MKKIYISFLTTRLDLMKRHWEQHAALKEKGISGTDKEIGRGIDLGGVLIEVDWDTKQILGEHPLSCPSGVCRWGDVLAVASMRRNEIYLFDEQWHALRTISHFALSDIHSMCVTRENSLLVVSSGVDGIVEFDRDGNCIWQWFAFDHGYTLDQFGESRALDMSGKTDHRTLDYPTLRQTTHINSVMQHKDAKHSILATLFHQGTLVAIDKKTGIATTLMNGLHNPHSIRKRSDGYMVTDTKKGSILLLDEDFKIYDVLFSDTNWLQDAIQISGGNFLAGRSNENEIVELDSRTKQVISSFEYDKNWRIYQIEEENFEARS